MKVSVRRCDPEIFPQLLSLVDDEFIHNKGRHLSLSIRYPSVLSTVNCVNLHMIEIDNVICSAVAVKRFQWLADGQVWKGAMIGLVCTAPQFRAQRLASLVLCTVVEQLREAGEDFAVLWTTINGFYERLGWFVQDRSCFGEVTRRVEPNAFDQVTPYPCNEQNAQWCEQVRSKWVSRRVARTPIDYQAIPVPADNVQCFAVSLTRDAEGYALVGDCGEEGYLYELIGDSCTFSLIWASITRRYRKLYINDQLRSLSRSWLDKRRDVTWRAQSCAMWLKLSPHMDCAPIDYWYVPYFDRI